MNENLTEIHKLLQEVVEHLKSGTKPGSREAIAKLKRIASLASTSALMLEQRR